MLTANAQYQLGNAKSYFQEHLVVGDYYQEGQAVAGQWFGQGAERLGLSGQVTSESFLALCDNLNPNTGEQLTARHNTVRNRDGRIEANRRVFYDFTFSPPKSVSILALIGKDSRIFDAHRKAVEQALGELETFGSVRIRKGGQTDHRISGNIVAARFHHDTSRALDPHVHTHCVVFNASWDPKDARWLALENFEMLRARKYAENVYYHELSRRMAAIGYKIRNGPKGDFQIEGISPELCDRFSKRNREIDAAMKRLVDAKPELKHTNLKDLREELAVSERSKKLKGVTADQLQELWKAQLTEAEAKTLHAAARPVPKPASEVRSIKEPVEWAEEHLFDRRSVVMEHEIWNAALERARGSSMSLRDLKQFTRSREYVRDRTRSSEVSTRVVLAREEAIVASAKRGIGKRSSLAEESRDALEDLGEEQRDAIQTILQSRDVITLFRGAAGTGKSYVLKRLVDALKTQRREIVVATPQRQQVVDLARGGFPNPTTLTSLLENRKLTNGSIVLVDESGQIGGKQMLALIRKVEAAGGRLILSGDTRQHGPVEASDALLAIERYAGVTQADLTEIRRQDPRLGKTIEERNRIRQYRRAVKEASEGNLAASFDRLEKLGAIVECTLADQQDRLAKDYLELAAKGESSVVVSQTWGEVRRVNEKVREGLKQRGFLGTSDTMVDALEAVDLTSAQKRDARYHPADTVAILQTPMQGIRQGAAGKFLGLTHDAVLFQFEGRVIRIPNRRLGRVSIYRKTPLSVTTGEQLLLKANRRLPDGRRASNGELVTVREVKPDGSLQLADGRTLPAAFREFVHGYAITSYGSQGKTVDHVLFSDSMIRAATNDQQWYVTISRGRRSVRIYTPDKEQLRQNVTQSGTRSLALELLATPHQCIKASNEMIHSP